MLYILIFFIAHWYLSLFFQTFFLHRYAAHKAFTMSPFTEKVFFVLTWVFQGSNYLSAYGYAILHRMHHAYADTEKDVHSPSHDPNLFAMMWRTKKIYSSILKNDMKLEARFTEGAPSWRAFDVFASSWPSRLMWGTLYTLFYMQFATEWWMYLLLPVQWLLSPIHGAIINWFAHVYGYRNFPVGDTSKNFLPFDFLMMGESYHNNHHKFGARANFGGIRWHEIDPTYLIIRLLNRIGVIQLRKEVQMKMDEEAKAQAA